MKLGGSHDCTIVDGDEHPTAGLAQPPCSCRVFAGVGRPAVSVAGGKDLPHESPDAGPIRIDDIADLHFGILTGAAYAAAMTESLPSVVLLVDIANVMGSRPDGWWRDRAAAATRLLNALEPLNAAVVTLPGVGTLQITEVRAVVEGAAKPAEGPEGMSVIRAERDGDSEIVEEANRLTASGKIPLVVTADRGLRQRLPERALIAGPGWLNRLLDR